MTFRTFLIMLKAQQKWKMCTSCHRHLLGARDQENSDRQASEHLVKFVKFLPQTGTSIQEHLDGIAESRQPYLLAVGTQRSVIHKYFIVIDKHSFQLAYI